MFGRYSNNLAENEAAQAIGTFLRGVGRATDVRGIAAEVGRRWRQERSGLKQFGVSAGVIDLRHESKSNMNCLTTLHLLTEAND